MTAYKIFGCLHHLIDELGFEEACDFVILCFKRVGLGKGFSGDDSGV